MKDINKKNIPVLERTHPIKSQIKSSRTTTILLF